MWYFSGYQRTSCAPLDDIYTPEKNHSPNSSSPINQSQRRYGSENGVGSPLARRYERNGKVANEELKQLSNDDNTSSRSSTMTTQDNEVV